MQSATASSNWLANLKDLGASLQQVAHDLIVIAKLETRLATISLLLILGLLFVSSFLCLTIWLGVLLALAFYLAQLGMAWPGILLIITGTNVVLLGMLALAIKQCSRHLRFSATRRQLGLQSSTEQGQNYVTPAANSNPTA